MKSVPGQSVSKQTLQRLPTYLSYLKGLQGDSKHISATAIAEALNINHVVVRKDLASISSSGRPKVGYVREDLIRELEPFWAMTTRKTPCWLARPAGKGAACL